MPTGNISKTSPCSGLVPRGYRAAPRTSTPYSTSPGGSPRLPYTPGRTPGCRYLQQCKVQWFTMLIVASNTFRRSDIEMQTEMVLGTPVALLVEEHGGIMKVAKDAGINHATLWRAMSGKFSPSYETRLKLARVFGCRLDEAVYPADMEPS